MRFLTSTLCSAAASLALLSGFASAANSTGDPSSCPGYKASNVRHGRSSITADLTLAGDACNLYNDDLKNLKLLVEYQTEDRIHVQIYDAEEQVFQIPDPLVAVAGSENASPWGSQLSFSMTESPFSFKITRKKNNEVLFDTSGYPIIFETQFLYMRTKLPTDPNIYGYGESADPFRHDPSNYSHTIWNDGEPFMPTDANLYGTHPIYYDHRGAKGTHAVFLRNINGQSITLGQDSDSGKYGNYLEYITIGGVFDMYFLAGSTPKQVSSQYADLIGHPTIMPYWGLGFHQCRYGYQDTLYTAAVVANYSAADIPLETIWNDIDYMDRRSTFSLDPYRFPLPRMREFVDTLHKNNQHYIMMVDPAVAARDYEPFNKGVQMNAFLQEQNGSLYTGVVWPGPTSFPDWFGANTQDFWTDMFDSFFNADTGVDIDGLWIDMNEPSNFCNYPCTDPMQFSIDGRDPPRPPPVRISSPYPVPGFPEDFQPHCFTTVYFNPYCGADSGEDLLLLGNASAMGYNIPYWAPQFPGLGGGYWGMEVQLEANSTFQYQLTRYTADGVYVTDPKNRTVTTGDCGSYQVVKDTVDTSINTPQYPVNMTDPRYTFFPGAGRGYGPGDPNTSSPPTVVKRSSAALEQKRYQPGSDKPGSKQGLSGRNLLQANYPLKLWDGELSNQGVPTNIIHPNGLAEYDVHNLFGSMMGNHSRTALLSRRPTKRPFIISRSTAAGDGARIGHWFGDNRSIDSDYRLSISQMIRWVSMFQMPMVGSDVCGFNYDTNPTLCSRWAVLGSWNPFFRNHAEESTIYQEFYRWPEVAEAARKAIATRYRLLDYTYSNLYRQTQDGTPMLSPLMWEYPEDANTFAIEHQFFAGDAFLVSPVTVPEDTSVEFYVPEDLFYDFDTYEVIEGKGANMTRDNVALDEIPVFVRGGNVVPMRVNSSYTTTELRTQDFELLIAPDAHGRASGYLYLDDGDSLVTTAKSYLQFEYNHGSLRMWPVHGGFGYDPQVKLAQATVLGWTTKHSNCQGYNSTAKTMTQTLDKPLTRGFSVEIGSHCGGY